VGLLGGEDLPAEIAAEFFKQVQNGLNGSNGKEVHDDSGVSSIDPAFFTFGTPVAVLQGIMGNIDFRCTAVILYAISTVPLFPGWPLGAGLLVCLVLRYGLGSFGFDPKDHAKEAHDGPGFALQKVPQV